MGAFAAGRVVLVHFPFSDLTSSKLRPAVVLAEASRGDSVLCQITSSAYGDAHAISLDAGDLASGSLHRASFVRPAKLFTAHSSLVLRDIAILTPAKLETIRDAVVAMIRAGRPT